LSCGLDRLADALIEARRFLGLAQPTPITPPRPEPPDGLPKAARRLLVMSYPIADTIAETYLRNRGITITPDLRALRFHPRCFYRITDEETGKDRYEVWPALLATVTDLGGKVTGVHRTWLDPSGRDKAPVSSPRRALGDLLGQGVRFGTADDVMVAGEGLETVLSVRTILPTMPMAAALSANHLAVFRPPPTLRRFYVAQDNDPAGERATRQLSRRAQADGVEVLTLTSSLKDFNEDLRHLGVDALRAALREQLVPEDAVRFIARAAG
jgi:Toprim domain